MPGSSSSTDSLPDGHVAVGRIGKPHGLKGDVFVYPETDNPDRFAPGATVFVDGRQATVAASRTSEGRLIVRFAHVSDRTAAEAARGSLISIAEHDRRELEADEWWPDQLVGLRVLDHSGAERGVVVAFVEGAAQDRLVVDTDGVEVEIPFVSALVPLVDVAAGVVQLADVDGLLTAE